MTLFQTFTKASADTRETGRHGAGAPSILDGALLGAAVPCGVFIPECQEHTLP